MRKGELVSRREVLRRLGGALAAVQLGACSEGSGESPDGADAGADLVEADMSEVLDQGAADQGAEDQAAADQGAQDQGVAGWATGGTAAMLARASYPDPFEGVAMGACALHCLTTVGPCHTASPERADVSDGLNGLPVRLALRVVDESCEPVQGAVVEIWHTNVDGVYSGRSGAICNEEEADRAARYFRGYLRTDASGRVDFDTCLPGWYPGRMVHIHVRVMTGEYNAASNAAASVVTQLIFPEAVVAEIFAGEPLYKEFGQPDRTLATDSVMRSAADPERYTVEVSRLPDGAMLASKTLVIKADRGGALCTVRR